MILYIAIIKMNEVSTFLNKLVLYPTIYYGMMMEQWGIRKWYTRIDNNCVLGALPMLHNYKQIIREENVKAVLTLNEDHELVYSIPKEEWSNLDIDYLQVGVQDYFGVATIDQINKCMDFIDKHKKKNQSVYVHCKAGRYRSALIVACYLIKEKEMKPETAIEYIKNLRPFVVLENKRQFNAMNTYYEHLYVSSSKKASDSLETPTSTSATPTPTEKPSDTN